MARKALLIGSQTGGLSGVHNDIESMAVALDRWGFTSTRCQAADATRAGILDAYERLIKDASPDDAIVVYYSGHGGYSRRHDQHTGAPPKMALQFIVPTDFESSREGDFRGIMSVELSLLLARLTDKTKNVVVALDCCHAAHMSKDDGRGLRVRSLPRAVSYDVVAGHFEGLRKRVEPSRYRQEGNLSAVRLVACSQEQAAYEYTNPAGVTTGMFTENLTRALSLAHAEGLRVSWASLTDRVRQGVLALMSSQRPDAEGPAGRLLFDTLDADTVATLPVLVSGDRVTLGGAALLGVHVGDEFTVMPDGSAGPDEATKIGDVVIDEVRTTSAHGPLKLRSAGVSVPLGARAYQMKAAAPTMPVRLPEGDPFAPLARQVEQSPLLRVAEADEQCPVQVRVDDGGALTVWDQHGPMHAPHPADAAGLPLIMGNLKRLARAARLRCLDADPAHELDTPIEVEFGTVSEDQPRPLPTSGAIIYIGQRIYIRVRNRGRHRVYVSLLDIGVSAAVTPLNPTAPGGLALDPEGEYTFGYSDFKQVLHGELMSWPTGLPRTQPRPETVLILVTSQPQNIQGIGQDGLKHSSLVGPGVRSSLERLFDQIDDGGGRDVSPDLGPAVRFTVRTVDFELVPVSPPVSEDPEFQVDERPPSSMRLWSPKGATPQNLSVRLTELVVHRNRALGSADIRLDAMVLTRGSGKQPVYCAWTQRCSNIRDGQTLPLDKILVYHGPAVDYLDLAVWVSRDVSGSLALSDLLQEKLTDNDVQMAMGQLGGLLAAAPQAAAAVAAIGAGAVVINAAYHLLTGIVGSSIGLYRTTLLAGERFGVGRPADQCTVRAQDFSFTYLIEDVD
jgi:hypothetical protein